MPSISYEDQQKEATEQIVHRLKSKEARKIVGLSYWSEINTLWQDNEPLNFKEGGEKVDGRSKDRG